LIVFFGIAFAISVDHSFHPISVAISNDVVLVTDCKSVHQEPALI